MTIKYQLKPGCESFEVMSGADAGKKFVRGRVYDRVPDGYADRFSPVGQNGHPVGVKKPDASKADKIPDAQVNAGRTAAADSAEPPVKSPYLGCAGKRKKKAED